MAHDVQYSYYTYAHDAIAAIWDNQQVHCWYSNQCDDRRQASGILA